MFGRELHVIILLDQDYGSTAEDKLQISFLLKYIWTVKKKKTYLIRLIITTFESVDDLPIDELCADLVRTVMPWSEDLFAEVEMPRSMLFLSPLSLFILLTNRHGVQEVLTAAAKRPNLQEEMHKCRLYYYCSLVICDLFQIASWAIQMIQTFSCISAYREKP